MTAGADLGAIFDEHVASEFETKDINATMATMVPEPYVWHVPVLTGASGGEAVRDFYVTHFIGQTPDDAVLHPSFRSEGVRASFRYWRAIATRNRSSGVIR